MGSKNQMAVRVKCIGLRDEHANFMRKTLQLTSEPEQGSRASLGWGLTRGAKKGAVTGMSDVLRKANH